MEQIKSSQINNPLPLPEGGRWRTAEALKEGSRWPARGLFVHSPEEVARCSLASGNEASFTAWAPDQRVLSKSCPSRFPPFILFLFLSPGTKGLGSWATKRVNSGSTPTGSVLCFLPHLLYVCFLPPFVP